MTRTPRAELAFPSLGPPFCPSPLDEDKALAEATRIVVAAANQIVGTVRTPMETPSTGTTGMRVCNTQ
ncbi:hypothetical protein FA95DRAFT_1609253 [Auriscalpium vulgare]|uniref:Uncharacterized protein n=1 Tax=Auriscalpium vulgare TaxID=40419 RepID=A0ACB8RHB3_9AGAM|nr:hypothetical protein FA95DRAFT_1609253 [Auriscalpium vulgare]